MDESGSVCGRMGRVGSQVSAVDGSGEDREQERRGEEWKHVSANDGMIQVNFIRFHSKFDEVCMIIQVQKY